MQLPQDFMPWNPQEEMPAPVKKRKLKPGVKAAFICLMVLVAVTGVLFGGLFRIRQITVVGNSRISQDEVIESAGIHRGMSYFAVTEDKVRRTMEQNRYLVCQRVEKFLPGTVALYVQERIARANVHVLGVTYLLDENGMVLERLSSGMNDHLPVATGMQTREVMVGKIIGAGNEDILGAYCHLVQELIWQGYLTGISELKVSDPDSLYLMTVDGYTVHLGQDENLRAKIGTVRAVVDKLKEMGHRGGVIEASVPGVATYTPSEM